MQLLLSIKHHFINAFWIAMIASVFGCVWETSLAFYRTGHLEKRVCMVHGPFNMIYGAGAVTLYLTFAFVRDTLDPFKSFLLGAFTCSTIEFVFAYIEEWAFGAKSWDYTKYPLNFKGKICAFATLAWGTLALLWVLAVWPVLDRLINDVPIGILWPLTITTFSLMLVNAILTVLALNRWTERVMGLSRTPNRFEAWLDDVYPNLRMKALFLNMTFTSGR